MFAVTLIAYMKKSSDKSQPTSQASQPSNIWPVPRVAHSNDMQCRNLIPCPQCLFAPAIGIGNHFAAWLYGCSAFRSMVHSNKFNLATVVIAVYPCATRNMQHCECVAYLYLISQLLESPSSLQAPRWGFLILFTNICIPLREEGL